MAEVKMNVKLMAHTKLSEEFYESFDKFDEFLNYDGNTLDATGATDGQAVALTAIRTCYSPNKPTEIVAKEGEKYFGNKATDGNGGSEADRLFRHIVKSGHSSTLEHISFTFAIEGVNRALLAQLTRHRVGFSFSVQSQRYVRLGSGDRSGGFDYVLPDKVGADEDIAADFDELMEDIQQFYDDLRARGIPAEDARAVLPNATATNLVMTANLTALLGFYRKRKPGNGAQKEITDLAVALKDAVIAVEPWTRAYFNAE